MKRIWWIFKAGQKWDGPYFSERLADAACLRARADGHGLVYVEQVTLIRVAPEYRCTALAIA